MFTAAYLCCSQVRPALATSGPPTVILHPRGPAFLTASFESDCRRGAEPRLQSTRPRPPLVFTSTSDTRAAVQPRGRSSHPHEEATLRDLLALIPPLPLASSLCLRKNWGLFKSRRPVGGLRAQGCGFGFGPGPHLGRKTLSYLPSFFSYSDHEMMVESTKAQAHEDTQFAYTHAHTVSLGRGLCLLVGCRPSD